MWKPLIAVLTASLLAACVAQKIQLRDVRTGLLATCGNSSHCVSSQETDDVHGIAPIRYAGPVGEARAKMGRVIKRMDGYTLVSNEGDYIHATLGNGSGQEQIELVFSQSEPGLIHLRSAGAGGFLGGAHNREHLEDIRRAFTIAKS